MKVQKLPNGFLSITGNTILCPQCVNDGTTSTVHTSCGFTTHAGVSSYHDENGNFHSHNSNETTSDWSCSLGHAGKAYSMSGCPYKMCDHQGYREYVVDPSRYSSMTSPLDESRSEEPKDLVSLDAVIDSALVERANDAFCNTNISIPSAYAIPLTNYFSPGTTYVAEPLKDPPLTLVGTVSYGGYTYQGVFHIQHSK